MGCDSASKKGSVATTSRTIPEPDTNGMQPAVASLISEARQSVEQAPSSAQAWGRLAEVLDAHARFRASPTGVQCRDRVVARQHQIRLQLGAHAVVLR